MTVAELISAFGAYYKNNGQGTQSLYQVLRQPFVTESMFTPIYTDETIWQAARASFNKVLQPFQRAFTPIQTGAFTPLEIRMFHVKGEVIEYPDDLEATWLGFLASSNLKRSEWPIVRWMIENQFYPQLKQDLELDAIGRGKFVAPTPGVASEPIKSMNGIQTIIDTHETGGRIIPITMGAVPTDDKLLVDYVEDFGDQIDKKYWSLPMDVGLSQSLTRRYARGYRTKYGKDIDFNAANGVRVQLTNLTLKPLPSMDLKNDGTACNRIFCTPKNNMVLLKKKTMNLEATDIQAVDRDVKVMTDFWLGAGFILPEIVFCTDQK
jgi:hypothetical protein